MRLTGSAKLWLASGPVPHFEEMVELGKAIASTLVEDLGRVEFIKRLSDPAWFSCLSCTLGFEHNTSGQTTVTLMALKRAFEQEELGLKVLGGKGSSARAVQQELDELGDKLGLSDSSINGLKRASAMTCKVDSAALQDSYDVYFHAMAVGEGAEWAAVNQGMNVEDKTARRYHWSFGLSSYVNEPHDNIIGDVDRPMVLDLTASPSQDCRQAMLDLVKDLEPPKIQSLLRSLGGPVGQSRLIDYILEQQVEVKRLPSCMEVPQKLNLDALSLAKEHAYSFEELLGTRGMGPSTIRGLAYVSTLIYGARCSWKDPIKYTYAFGTKSGRPWFVERDSMREASEVLTKAVREAKLGEGEKLKAIKRLKDYLRFS